MSIKSRYETVSADFNLFFASKKNMSFLARFSRLSLLLLCCTCFRSLAQIPLPSLMKQQLDSIATQDVPVRAPGIATAIIQKGTVVYEKYAGIADFADSSSIGPSTRFNIASNGKQFTALAILCLIEEKKLRLSDDIRKYFPSLYTTIKTPITIQHLLTHTSGIRDVYDIWSLQGLTWWKQNFSNKDVLSLLQKQEALNFPSGTQYLYSNSNYILLALLVERITKNSFKTVTDELFKKMQLFQTAFEDDYTQINGQIARAYFNFNTWTTYTWIWNVCGDGNLFSTLKDQIRWEQILQGTVQSGIKKEIIVKSQQLVNASLTKKYGYGLEFGQYHGKPYTFHEGATGAWKATVIRFPEESLSMITLTNTGKSIPSMQTRQMADIFFPSAKNISPLITQPTSVGNFVTADEITGTYLTDNNFSFQFEQRNGSLYLKRVGRNDILLEREAANIFHQKNDPAFKQEFSKNEKGEMQVTAYYTTHAPYSLTRPSVNWSGFLETSWNGNYSNQETGVSIRIDFKSGKEYDIQIGKNNTSKGILVTPATLLAGNYSFKKDTTHNNVLYLDGDRIKKIKFIRQP